MTNFEIEFLNWIREVISPFFDNLFEGITNLGGQEILIVVIIIIYFIVSKKAGQRIAFTVFSSLLFNNAAKGLINRPRPFTHENAHYDLKDSILENATGQSFPSGHSQNSAVTYTSIALVFKKKSIWIAAIILITLIGLSRVLLGVHYPTDVIFGIALGIGFAFLGAYLHKKVEDNFKKQILLYLVVALLYLPFLFILWNKVNSEFEKYKDYYTSYAFYIGYIIAVVIDYKFINFDCKGSFPIRIIRSVIALILVIALLFGLKTVFEEDIILLDMLRYFLLAFIGLGIYPLLTKKYLFKNNNN